MPRTLGAVLFDLDGTLIDSIALIVDAMHHAFEGFSGPTPADTDWMAGIGTPLSKQLALYARNGAELETLRDRYRSYQAIHHDTRVREFPGTTDVLASLHGRGLAMALVTSKMDALARRGLDLTGLARFIPVVVGADAVTKHKPGPEPVLLALERLGVSADAAAFVGDSPHDIASGNAAGVTTIGALWGPFTREQIAVANPAHFIADIRELPGVLALIEGVDVQ
ncbi:MAG TPA: HAD-IA family hydrolase [Gemmatimonadaceae bacterium]|nr:HAD-IA family hydrolase [Gemmatimonadaceae bacterium]